MQNGDSLSWSSRIGKLALGMIGTLILGAIGSGLWEIFFRPGLTHFGNFITSISGMADGAVYTTAALDPTPVPALVLLLLLVQVPAFAAMWFVHKGFFEPFIEHKVRRQFEQILVESESRPDDRTYVVQRLRGKIRIISIFGICFSMIFFVLFIYAYTIENRAVLVWRVFHQNLDICRPYLSGEVQAQTLSDFRRMTSGEDFSRIRARLDSAAEKHNVILDWRDAR